MGPVEAFVEIESDGESLSGRSLSGAVELLRALPGGAAEGVDLDAGLLAFTAQPGDDGWVGELTAPWPGREIRLSVEPERLEGSIGGGPLRGRFSGVPATEVEPLRDYPAIVATLDDVVRAKLFDPADLEEPAYDLFRERLGAVAAVAVDDLDVLVGFSLAWTNDPFSHFALRRSPASAAAMMASFDDYRVGREAARVAIEDGVAVLRVDTMMGNDTIEQIRAAYAAIDAAGAEALIIDLRGNEGGAFAVKPLVEHVVDEPLDAGYFLAQPWNRAHDRLPTAAELQAVAPWQGWSILAFWKSVQEEGLLKVRFEPAEPNFDGPVWVLIDNRSASATELAADGLRASGAAILVGERTAGQMLSQSVFDVADGFLVSLPVADYYSVANGRIEGAGVPPHQEIEPADALEAARAMARAAIGD